AARLSAEYGAVTKAFRHNVDSALSTIAMPFSLAHSSVTHSQLQRFHIAERIRSQSIDEKSLGPGENLEVIRDRHARAKADNRMREFVEFKDGQKAIIGQLCDFLLSSLENGLEPAAADLLRQGLVLLWSGFEVLFRDTFESLLNRQPERVAMLIKHPTTRKRFDAERLPLDTLVEHGFDLSRKLGTVLVGQQDLGDLPTIKSVYGVLFPECTGL